MAMEARYDFQKSESEAQAFWERAGIYRFDRNADGALYSIDTPPPTVSGSLHIGHLFSYVQAEMIARFHRMQGENVFYPFGFDDNGLPTERLVERETGARAGTMPRDAFIAQCRAVAEAYEREFQMFWNTLGFSVDWLATYRTAGRDVMKISQALFLELVEKGRAYAKESPVLWCTECGTSIAQAELDTAEADAVFAYIPFALPDGREPLTVATTRPELLGGCVCLFVNPRDARYTRHIGATATVPLYDYAIPILADERADMNKGTGVVMCATFGDATDAEWYAEYGLPYRKVILPDGRIDGATDFIGGLNVPAARREILRLLGERGLLIKTEAITHAVGTHERCGTPVEIIPSRQWYIDVLRERDRFLKAADDINWYPPSMKNRYIAWVENLKWDWCVSRQRYFGVPIPVWYCKHCGAPALARPELLPVNPLDTPYEGVCACGCTAFEPETAVLDTWATSSVTPQINERLEPGLTPMSMRTHAHEIIRTWTFYTIVRSLYHTGGIPWKDLMICGFVLAKKGEKISKSKSNNAFEPRRLIESHSADALRYWAAAARLGTDTYFAPEELTVPKRFITKLWNACRFVIANLDGFEPGSGKPDLREPFDRWIVERADETTARAAKLLHAYEIGQARHEIDAFFWTDFCDSYIELVKERLYEPECRGEVARSSARHALYYALLNILKLYSIYTPHITERVYQEFFRRHERAESIHLTRWARPAVIDGDIVLFGENLKTVLSEMRKYKSERSLSIRAPMDELVIRAAPRWMEWFRLAERDLLACSNAKHIKYIAE